MSAILPAEWPAPPHVRAFTTLRHGAGRSQAPFDSFNLGTRYGQYRDDPAVVEANRAELMERFGLPSPPRWLHQIHGTGVVRFGRDAAQDEPDGDAAVTDEPGVVLAILTADCLPVVFASDDGRTIGAAHAGWRGLAGGVLERTVESMRVAPERLLVWLGPAAGPQAYEIGEEVHDVFVGADPRAASAFEPTRPGHWRVDLYALARLRLEDAGVTRIHGGGLCTITDAQRFYSHRRDAQTGRMATLIWMQP
jgi:YfiH family protein